MTGESSPLGELAQVLARLGATSFGGLPAYIALLMEEEIVARGGWRPRERLPDLLGVANLVPGPLGRRRRTPWTAAFLDAVNVAALALILAVATRLMAVARSGLRQRAIAAGAFEAPAWWPVNPAWIVLAGGAIL